MIVRISLAVPLGLALIAFSSLWFLPPPHAQRSERPRARIDDVLPEFQFEEFHERFVRAAPEAIDQAIRSVPANEIRFFRVLTWIRNPGRPWAGQGESLLNPPSNQPILDVALRSSFVLLADDPGHEMVLGTFVVRPPGVRVEISNDPAETARRFAALETPGYAKAVMNFRIEPSGEGCRLTTETRIYATDPGTAHAFARYWRAISFGSALLRRTWLKAIAARAETRARPAS
ncbi:MAG: hypothetical protein WCC53_12375 [Thermoanaerobaculia bacterium]